MIDWRNIKERLTALIAHVSDAGPSSVRWRDEASAGTWAGSPLVELRVMAVANEGIEFEVRESNGSADQTVTLVGQRRFTLTVVCRSFTQDIADYNFAGNVAGRIAIRMLRTSSREMLDGCCALETREPVRWFNTTADGRQVSVYVLDLHMRTVDIDEDTTHGAGGWFDRAVVQSNTLNDVTGQPLSEQSDLLITSQEPA